MSSAQAFNLVFDNQHFIEWNIVKNVNQSLVSLRRVILISVTILHKVHELATEVNIGFSELRTQCICFNYLNDPLKRESLHHSLKFKMLKPFCLLLFGILSVSAIGCMSPGIPHSFKNCKTSVCHSGAYTGYNCNNGICPYICIGNSCTQVGVMGSHGYPNRPYGLYSVSQGFGMPDTSYSDFGMTGYGGGSAVDQFGGGYGYDFVMGNGYAQDMGHSLSSRRSRTKRESHPNSEFDEDDKSNDSEKTTSGSSN